MDTRSTNYTPWIAPSTPTLPRESDQMAICYDSSNIYLIGGTGNGSPYKQLVSYNIDNNNFTDHGVSYFPTALYIYGWTQYYSQLADTLWIINNNDANSKSLNKFNITSLNMAYKFTSMPSNTNGAYQGCLASYDSGDGYIIVTGGLYNSSTLDTVNVYDIGSNVWLSGVSKLQTRRIYHACTVHNDELYIIGGTNDGGFGQSQISYLKSIEYITVSTTDNWSHLFVDMNDTLYAGIGLSNAVVFGNDILVIGGRDGNDNANNYINVIDTVSKTVRYGGSLKYGVYRTSVVIVNNYIYAFAGYTNNDFWIDTFQYHAISTAAPTMHPTTSIPTTSIPTTVIPTTTIPTTTSLLANNPTYNTTTNPKHITSTDIVPNIDTSTIGAITSTSDVNITFNLTISSTDDSNDDIMIYLSVAGISCVYLLVIALYFMYHKFKSKHKSNKKSVDQLVAMVDVVNNGKVDEQSDDNEDMYNNNNNNIETKNGITNNNNDNEEMYVNPKSKPHCTTPNTFIRGEEEEEDEESDGEIMMVTSTGGNVTNTEIDNTSIGKNDDIGEV